MRILIVATLLLAACGNDRPDLKLLDAGTGTRQVLRYSVTKGTTYKVVMTMEMDLGRGLMPTVSFTMEIKVTDVAPEGDISYDFRYTDVGVDGGEAPSELKNLMSMTGSAVVDSRGVNKAFKIRLADNAPAALKQMMGKFEEQLRQLSCPFPEEAVGIGAKWVLTQDLDAPAFGLRQIGTFELVEFEGNRGKLKLSLTQSAEDQKMSLPSGIEATLISLKSAGTGELEFDLTKPVPVNSFIEISSDVHIKMKDETHRQKIGIKITLKEK